METLDRLLHKLPPPLCTFFADLPDRELDSLREIRLRTGRPAALHSAAGVHLLGDGALVTQKLLCQTVAALCDFSVYTHSETIGEGYFTVAGGHRVGFCGSRNSYGKVDSASVSSLNIRVAREVPGCAREVVAASQMDAAQSLLLFGEPGTGKTTWLRDVARTLSSAPFLRTCVVVDERSEIAAMNAGVSPFTLGDCCDVLDRYARAAAFDVALRTLSPQYILCDEIGLEEDYASFCECAKSGVRMIATAHAGSPSELLGRKNLAAMLNAGVFQYAAQLTNRNGTIQLKRIYKVV